MTTHKAKPGGSVDKFVRILSILQTKQMTRAQIAAEVSVQYDTADCWLKTLAAYGLVKEVGAVVGEKGGVTKLFGWSGTQAPDGVALMPSQSKGGGIHSIEDIKQRCWIDEETGCWQWRSGYSTGMKEHTYKTPCMRIPALNASVSAGVAICFFKTGARPAKGKVWHVTCTTPNCCNPEHRKAGTKSSMNKSPAVKPLGPLHAQRVALGRRKQSTKCNDEIAAAIRSSDEPLKVLAARYNLDQTYVSKIRLGRLWRPIAQGVSVFSLAGVV